MCTMKHLKTIDCIVRGRMGEMNKTRWEVAAECKMSRQTLDQVINGKDCRFSTLLRVCRYLGIDNIPVV